MIFVTVGNPTQPFDRLLRNIDEIASQRIYDEPFLIQRGYSKFVPRYCRFVDFLEMNEVEEQIRACSAVVMHGGTGSIMTALQVGKRPIVVPRRKRFGDGFNDHQMEISAEFAKRGLIYVAHTMEDINKYIGLVQQNKEATPIYHKSNQRLMALVSDYIQRISG